MHFCIPVRDFGAFGDGCAADASFIHLAMDAGLPEAFDQPMKIKATDKTRMLNFPTMEAFARTSKALERQTWITMTSHNN